MDFDVDQRRAPGFFRRLAALFYDLVLLLGIVLIATTLVVIPYNLLTGAPFPHDESFHLLGLRLYLIAVICLFYWFFWVRGGQTLGMRTWRFRLVREDGAGLRTGDALVRLLWATVCLAPAGAGFLWMLLDRDRLTCYDRLSRSRPVMVTREATSEPPRRREHQGP
jgi:uncharacterized RDD family membrane protein YckC